MFNVVSVINSIIKHVIFQTNILTDWMAHWGIKVIYLYYTIYNIQYTTGSYEGYNTKAIETDATSHILLVQFYLNIF